VDVAVVGGGPAGTAAAVAAARRGASIALFDRVDARRHDVGETVPPGTAALVTQLFGDGAFDPSAHLPNYGTWSVWGDDEVTVTDSLVTNPFGFGWHLDRAAFDDGLRHAATQAGVHLVEASVTAIERDGERWELATVDREGRRSILNARAVIDATGRRAMLARAAGARRRVYDRLCAAVTWFTDPAPREHVLIVEAVEAGWWYTAPAPNDHRVCVFLTDADLFPHEVRTGFGFGDLLASTIAVGAVIGAGARRSEPRLVAADTATLDPCGGAGWLATGDAAASFDPLSGQGIATALVLGETAGGAAHEMLHGAHGGARLRYQAEHDRLVTAHLVRRDAHYRDEWRWSDAPFWRRRHVAALTREDRAREADTSRSQAAE